MDKLNPLPEQPATPDASEIAKAFSSLGASKGGKARAASLTRERRQEIAQRAIEARWEKAGKLKEPTLRAICGSSDHPLKIGDFELPCFVLEGGKRVLHQRGMVSALGMARGSSGGTGGDRLAKFVGGERLKDFVSQQLRDVTERPIKFVTPDGLSAYGYEATVLADICEAVLEARKQGFLQKQQGHIAAQCEILVRGFARVGIVALVDEATGYQDMRARDALAKILEAYIAKEWRSYVAAFPITFFKELCRLKNVVFREDMKLPRYFGHHVNDLVWDRLAPGVKDELRAKNPPDESGRRKRRHHQWLTEGIGHPKLLHHLGILEGLARGHKDGDFEAYRRQVDAILPSYSKTPLLAYAQEQRANGLR